MTLWYDDLADTLRDLGGVFQGETYKGVGPQNIYVQLVYIWHFPNDMKLMVETRFGVVQTLCSTFFKLADQPDNAAVINWLTVLVGMWQAADGDPNGKELSADEVEQMQ